MLLLDHQSQSLKQAADRNLNVGQNIEGHFRNLRRKQSRNLYLTLIIFSNFLDYLSHSNRTYLFLWNREGNVCHLQNVIGYALVNENNLTGHVVGGGICKGHYLLKENKTDLHFSTFFCMLYSFFLPNSKHIYTAKSSFSNRLNETVEI